MENISPITEPIAVDIEIRPYMRDHRFGDRAVLPAVETMQILARTAGGRIQGTPGRQISEARFDKFLALPDHADRIETVVELGPPTDGRVRAWLKTRIRAGKSAMTRVKTHGCLWVSALGPEAPGPLSGDVESRMTRNCFSVDPQRLYTDLVPFGPAYRNIDAPLCLSQEGALARIRAPRLPARETVLGSPFVLDAAFHAACVWGQRHLGVVAFPVALEQRSVWEPTRAGETYWAVALPRAVDPARLVFDISIFGPKRQICETVLGVVMRDVSGGRWKPPGWIGEGNR